MAVQNSVRSYLGIAKEVTKGTAVAATDYIPVMAAKVKPVDVIDPLFDQGLRGSLVENYNYIPGRTRSTFDFGGMVFADTIGYPLAGILGSVTTTGASAPFIHAITLKNSAAAAADAQPLSYTLTDFYAAAVRQYAGIQFHDFSLKFSAEGLMEYDAKATGWISATTTAPTPTFSTVLPQPVWTGTVTIGGTTISNIVDGTLALKRPVTPIYGISNTQNPYSIFVGALETTGSFTFVMENDTELTRYLTNTQPALVLTWTSGAGASLVEIKATMTKGAYVAAANDRGGDYVTITCDVNAQGNTTDVGTTAGYGNVSWSLKNAKASGTYA